MACFFFGGGERGGGGGVRGFREVGRGSYQQIGPTGGSEGLVIFHTSWQWASIIFKCCGRYSCCTCTVSELELDLLLIFKSISFAGRGGGHRPGQAARVQAGKVGS